MFGKKNVKSYTKLLMKYVAEFFYLENFNICISFVNSYTVQVTVSKTLDIYKNVTDP